MLKSKIAVVLFLVLLLAGAVPSWGQTVAAPEDEGKLIAVLKSNDASRKDKVDACRQLAVVGTAKAIPTLAALLGDEQLSHNARYALEPIPDPAVDEAFRAALGKLKGLPLVGVIGSVGVRRDAQAVPQLAKLLTDSDPLVARAAARALGSIGNAAAVAALEGQLGSASAITKLHVCEGLFRGAEALAAAGKRAEAMAIYDRLRGIEAPHQVRAGALRGAILTRGADGLELLREHLGSGDYILFSAAVQTAQEMKDGAVTSALTGALKGLPADNQILIMQTLGLRDDADALPALFKAAQSGPEPVRVAALKAIAEIDHVSAVPILTALLADSNRPVADAAQEALGSLTGDAADAAVMEMFRSADTGKRLAALELMERRRMTQAVPVLLKAADDVDTKVRPAAIKMVGELGGSAQLSALLDALLKLQTSGDLEAMRQALSDVCGKAGNPESCSGKLIGRLDQARPAQKIVLLRVLSGVGGQDALKAVRRAVGDSDAEVHAAAIRALGSWKTTDAAPLLLALAKEAATPSDRAMSLRAYLGMAARRDLPVAQRLAMCREAQKMVQRDGEKRLLLGTLGGINSAEALSVIAPYLNDAAIRQEAVLASLSIADRLLRARDSGRQAPLLIAPLEKVVQVPSNDDLSRRAKALLQQAKTKAGR
ncbi:MAG: HEAT repeat domain-containing protein [Phycisphaerales bacterium]|nr:MAG: HEAT repeat domain-containing protein [Phycisphaerales bacterium]